MVTRLNGQAKSALCLPLRVGYPIDWSPDSELSHNSFARPGPNPCVLLVSGYQHEGRLTQRTIPHRGLDALKPIGVVNSDRIASRPRYSAITFNVCLFPSWKYRKHLLAPEGKRKYCCIAHHSSPLC